MRNSAFFTGTNDVTVRLYARLNEHNCGKRRTVDEIFVDFLSDFDAITTAPTSSQQ